MSTTPQPTFNKTELSPLIECPSEDEEEVSGFGDCDDIFDFSEIEELEAEISHRRIRMTDKIIRVKELLQNNDALLQDEILNNIIVQKKANPRIITKEDLLATPETIIGGSTSSSPSCSPDINRESESPDLFGK